MIANLPTAADLYQSGKELLDFAWDTTSNLLTEFDEADCYGYDKEEISEKYWAAARRRLTTSLAVAQQGAEFILKGKIAAISPYLLIADAPTRILTRMSFFLTTETRAYRLFPICIRTVGRSTERQLDHAGSTRSRINRSPPHSSKSSIHSANAETQSCIL